MNKDIINLLTFIIMGFWIVGEPLMAAEKSSNDKEPQIILYQKGKQTVLDNRSINYKLILQECERLFLTSDSTFQLIMTTNQIKKIKMKQNALEIIYPIVQNGKIMNQEIEVLFTKLLIPISGKFSNGTIFFAGDFKAVSEGKVDYGSLSEYGTITFVNNSRGIYSLKAILKEANIDVNGL